MTVLAGLSLVLGITNLLSLDHGQQQSSTVEPSRRAEDARIEDFPYHVSLRVNDEHFCGASIISENEILTAAHCVFNVPINQLSVRVGSAIHFEGESFVVRSIAIHQTYNYKNLDCDIAVLILDRRLTYGPRVQAIDLAEQLPPDGTLARVTGWGIQNDGVDVLPDVLKVTTVRLIDRGYCRAWYPNEIVTGSMICAGYEDARRDPCQGDSGGPLVDRTTGKQVGVVSWGGGCSQPARPTVYAAVPILIDSKDL